LRKPEHAVERSGFGALEPYSRANFERPLPSTAVIRHAGGRAGAAVSTNQGQDAPFERRDGNGGIGSGGALLHLVRLQSSSDAIMSMAEYLRRDAPLTVVYGMKPSLSVCMKLTI